VILDGAVDPNAWYRTRETSKPLLTYSTDSYGCRLIELGGDNASGDDVKALLNYAHDVISSVSILGDPTDSVYILGGPPALS
jgi:hypothetical protein